MVTQVSGKLLYNIYKPCTKYVNAARTLLVLVAKIKIHRTIILPVVLYGCETWFSHIEGGTQAECGLRIGC